MGNLPVNIYCVFALACVPFFHILLGMGKIQVWAYQCERCGHYWLPHHKEDEKRQVEPRVCPKCKSPYWNVPRKEQRMPAYSEKKVARVSKTDT